MLTATPSVKIPYYLHLVSFSAQIMQNLSFKKITVIMASLDHACVPKKDRKFYIQYFDFFLRILKCVFFMYT